jgi:hypothetical protein
LVIVSVIVVEWVRLPLVPVRVMVNVPLAVWPPLPVKVSVEVPLPDTLPGLKLAETPDGSAPVDSETVPVKPFNAVMVMVVDVELVLAIDRLDGDALMLKSPPVPGAVTVRL